MDYLLNKSTDPKEKLYLLTYYADQFRTTVFRQTMFAEFEKIIHERAEQGEALTPQLLSEIYYDLNVQYHGNSMAVDKDIEMEWARIPISTTASTFINMQRASLLQRASPNRFSKKVSLR